MSKTQLPKLDSFTIDGKNSEKYLNSDVTKFDLGFNKNINGKPSLKETLSCRFFNEKIVNQKFLVK